MLDPITAVAAASKAWALVQTAIAANSAIEDTFEIVSRWQESASDVLYLSQKAQSSNPFKKVVFAKSAEAEAVQIFAAKKKIEAQRRELIVMLNYAYGKQGVEEYRQCVREVNERRQREIYAKEEAKDAAVKTIGIAVLGSVALGLIYFIISVAT